MACPTSLLAGDAKAGRAVRLVLAMYDPEDAMTGAVASEYCSATSEGRIIIESYGVRCDNGDTWEVFEHRLTKVITVKRTNP